MSVRLDGQDSAAYRTAIGHFATGVAIVTSRSDGGPSGLTANAVASLSLDPLLMIVCLDRSARTLAAVEHRRRLAVNVLGQHQQALAVRFSSKAPEAEKFEGVGYRDVEGLPVLDGVVAWVTGRVREMIPGGDHVIAVVDVEDFEVCGGEPLIFFRGGYHSLGP